MSVVGRAVTGFGQVARWIEQIHPFTLLLLVVFICQHLQVKDLGAVCAMEASIISSKIVPPCAHSDMGQGKKNDVCMRFMNIIKHDVYVEWFKLDISSGDLSSTFELKTTDIAYASSSVVTLGSVIYVIGGLKLIGDESPRDVYYFDSPP